MKIRRVLPYLKKEWLDSLGDFLDTYDYFQEGIVEKVEERIKELTGRKYALCVNSASNAIFMCLYIIKRRNFHMDAGEVIMSNYGYPSAYKACRMLGIRPVSVDIKLDTLSMNPELLIDKMCASTIAVVHLGNNGVIGSDIEEIKNICDTFPYGNVVFLEDSAPSMLQEFNGKKAGCFGDFSIYSFSATKPVTCGEGGVILTDDEKMYEELKILRHTPKYYNLEPSLNFCLSPFLAAYLLPQLSDDYLNESIELREKIHERYKHFGLKVFEEEGITNRYGAVMYLCDKAETISKRFDQMGIEHRYKHYTLYDDGFRYPVSQKVINTIIDLPSHYYLTDDEILSIINIIGMVKNA